LLGLSVAASGAGSTQPTSEHIVVDGVSVYRTERSDGGRAVYTLSRLDPERREAIEQAQIDPAPWATTGDLAGCKFLAAKPGSVTADCALMLAADQSADLNPITGPAQVVHSVCGREPYAGEVAACEGQVVAQTDVDDSLTALRSELEKR
jgi:hypothetical protein